MCWIIVLKVLMRVLSLKYENGYRYYHTKINSKYTIEFNMKHFIEKKRHGIYKWWGM